MRAGRGLFRRPFDAGGANPGFLQIPGSQQQTPQAPPTLSFPVVPPREAVIGPGVLPGSFVEIVSADGDVVVATGDKVPRFPGLDPAATGFTRSATRRCARLKASATGSA